MLSTINEYKNGSLESYELLRKEKMSKLTAFIDFWVSGLITLKNGLFQYGEYFLFIYKDKALLVKKKKNNIVDEIDVTNKIKNEKTFKKFELDGFIYSKYRKI